MTQATGTFHPVHVGPSPRGWRTALNWVFAPLAAHPRALLTLNLMYWGTALLAALYALTNPGLQQTLLAGVGEAFSGTGVLATLGNAYSTGEVLSAIALTFVVNLVVGTFAELTLLSAVVPFFGILFGLVRAVLWGLIFAPSGVWPVGALPHALTAVVEGEAYIVAMLGVWLWWWPVVRTPGGRWHAWMAGLHLQARIYAAVVTLLAVAAIYEALELIYLVPLLVPAE